MVKSLFAFISGAVAISAVVAAPAHAQDVESKVLLCAACHGPNGEPTDPKSTPIIWGQQSNYLYKELHDFHSGDRASPIMAPTARSFQLPDLREIANYFAAKTWPAGHPAADAPASVPEGGAMCLACHGQKFEGGQPAPRLAGLSYEYLIGAMNSFANGQRTNNLDMPGFMKALTDKQREAIAHYIAGL